MKRYPHLYIRQACNRITVSLAQFYNKVHESNLIPTLTIFLTFEIYCCCKSFFQIFTILKPFGYILKAVLCDYQIFAKSSAAVPSGAPLSLIHTSPFIRKGTMQCGVSSILHLLWIFPLMLFAWTLCQLWTSFDRELVAPGQPSMEQTNSGLQKCFALNASNYAVHFSMSKIL